MTYDFKKEEKQFYSTQSTPQIVEVPTFTFLTAKGVGNPNTSAAYQNAVGALYAVAYAVKMSKKQATQPKGYFDFVVPPLESFWAAKEGGVIEDILDKENFAWTAKLRLPDFVTEEVFEEMKRLATRKKKEIDFSVVSLEKRAEGLTAQILHTGSFDEELKTVTILENFIAENGFITDFTEDRQHHEIYFSDPRKVAPEKLKTLIRLPIKKGGGIDEQNKM